jgi:hypothetical protein
MDPSECSIMWLIFTVEGKCKCKKNNNFIFYVILSLNIFLI